ncbi:hypothetical protein DL98DRAFT_539290 [Cadophora sp. DSE1049]|nr:hypothetical protein DL98DRAFT_539290 [Cadophora sp. DSE1049]
MQRNPPRHDWNIDHPAVLIWAPLFSSHRKCTSAAHGRGQAIEAIVPAQTPDKTWGSSLVDREALTHKAAGEDALGASSPCTVAVSVQPYPSGRKQAVASKMGSLLGPNWAQASRHSGNEATITSGELPSDNKQIWGYTIQCTSCRDIPPCRHHLADFGEGSIALSF